MGGGRVHRIAGVVILAGALLLAFLVARGASFPVAGQPVVDWPQPPAVGTCQELDGSALRTVPCDQPHGMEVTKVWQAVDALPKDMIAACVAAADTYLGAVSNPAVVDGWHPDAPYYSAYQWGAPPTDVVGGRGWTVCLIAPWRPAEYTGSVRSLGSLSDRPAAYGECGLSDQPTLVPCDQPHNWEQLGQATQDLASAGDDQAAAKAAAERLASCDRLAAALIGVVDPTYGDRLQIRVDATLGSTVTIGDQITYGFDTPSSTPVPANTPGSSPATSTAPSSTVPPTAASSTSDSGPGTAASSSPSSPPASSATSLPPTSSAPPSVPSAPSSNPGQANASTPPSPAPSSQAVPSSQDTTTPAVTAVPTRPARPVAMLTCQVLDPHEQLLESLMGWGDRPLPIK